MRKYLLRGMVFALVMFIGALAASNIRHEKSSGAKELKGARILEQENRFGIDIPDPTLPAIDKEILAVTRPVDQPAEVYGMLGQPGRVMRRGTIDTLDYGLPAGTAFGFSPGDNMSWIYQAPADLILNGVAVDVQGWATAGSFRLKVEVFKPGYPNDATNELYPRDVVDGDGWLGFWHDATGADSTAYPDSIAGVGALVWNEFPGDTGYCAATVPYADAAPLRGEVVFPLGFVSMEIDSSMGTGEVWLDFAQFGTPPTFLSGEWIGISVLYTFEEADVGAAGTQMGLWVSEGENLPHPYRGIKYYQEPCGGTSGEAGWHIRHWVWHYPMAVELTGDRGPVFEDVSSLPTAPIEDDRPVWAVVTDDNPAGGSAGVASVILSYSTDGTTFSDISMTQVAGTDTFTVSIPGQAGGTSVWWELTATDVNGNSTVTPLASYFVFEPVEPILFLENGLPFSQGTNEFFWMFGAAADDIGEYRFDYWSNSEFGSKGLTESMAANYDVIMEFGGAYPEANMAEIFHAWIKGGTAANPRSYLLASQDHGCFISGCADTTFPAGAFEYDYLGIETLGPQDIPGGGSAVWRVGPVENDPISGPFFDYLADHDTLGLFYQPAFELTASFGNWLDGMVANNMGVASFTDPSDASYVTGVHAEGTGFKTVFLGFDPIALDFQTLDDTTWVAWAIDYSTAGTGTNFNAVDFALDWFEAPSVTVADEVRLPKQYKLVQNFPNPFNPVTAINFELPVTSQVTLEVYNLLGQKVATLVNEFREAGAHTVVWDGRNELGQSVSTGLYLYRIDAGDFSATKKMIMLK